MNNMQNQVASLFLPIKSEHAMGILAKTHCCLHPTAIKILIRKIRPPVSSCKAKPGNSLQQLNRKDPSTNMPAKESRKKKIGKPFFTGSASIGPTTASGEGCGKRIDRLTISLAKTVIAQSNALVK